MDPLQAPANLQELQHLQHLQSLQTPGALAALRLLHTYNTLLPPVPSDVQSALGPLVGLSSCAPCCQHAAPAPPPPLLSLPQVPTPLLSPPCETEARRRGEKRPIPPELKDDKYFERRRRNNQAAKKSRDARRIREDQIAWRACLLEQENACLRAHAAALRQETIALRRMLEGAPSSTTREP